MPAVVYGLRISWNRPTESTDRPVEYDVFLVPDNDLDRVVLITPIVWGKLHCWVPT